MWMLHERRETATYIDGMKPAIFGPSKGICGIRYAVEPSADMFAVVRYVFDNKLDIEDARVVKTVASEYLAEEEARRLSGGCHGFDDLRRFPGEKRR